MKCHNSLHFKIRRVPLIMIVIRGGDGVMEGKQRCFECFDTIIIIILSGLDVNNVTLCVMVVLAKDHTGFRSLHHESAVIAANPCRPTSIRSVNRVRGSGDVFTFTTQNRLRIQTEYSHWPNTVMFLLSINK